MHRIKFWLWQRFTGSQLRLAQKIGQETARLRFDWPDAAAVFEKVREEFRELEEAAPDETHAREELGDLLFALVQYARLRGWDAEAVLREGNLKFLRRFGYLSNRVAESGRPWDSYGPDELEALWREAKRLDTQ